jgi:hypothetical protein
VICGNPAFNQIEEIVCFDENLLGFGACRSRGMIVIDYVALPPTGLKEIEQMQSGGSESEPGGLKGEAMMALSSREPISSAGDGHFCRLQGCIVSSGEPIYANIAGCKVCAITECSN